MKTLKYIKETDTDVWEMQAILEPIVLSANERGIGISYDLNPALTIDVLPLNSDKCQHLTMTHQGFQPILHQCQHLAAPHTAPKEFNPAPAIFAGIMIACAAFHGWGFVQYYRGSIDNRVECRQ
ncbi:hypothetical protein [Floridanema evergladense]|uniref:Uncharacterized protein n=1 Tax=Floridaenema evergladense BLCC-F167 TaxID=3153639 RepID=A0ABV4WD02_9CYAN